MFPIPPGRSWRLLPALRSPLLLRRRYLPSTLDARAPEDPEGGDAPAEIKIGTAVIAVAPERFGANIDVPDHEPWLPNALVLNNWIADGGMEPVVMRYKGAATGGDAIAIEDAAAPSNQAGLFDGATVRIYREEGDAVHLLRRGSVLRHLTGALGGWRLLIDGEGPPVQAGDLYFVSTVRDDAPGAAGTWHIYPNWGDNAAVSVGRDRDAAPGGGCTSLRVAVSSPMEGGVLQFIAGAPRRRTLDALVPGRLYRISLWLKGQFAGGAVTVSLYPCRRPIRRTFRIDGAWAAYQFTFRGPRQLAHGEVLQLSVTFRGPGTLWIDDVCLSEVRRAPHSVRPEALRALQEFRPGVLRIWSGQTNTAWGTSLDSWLAPEGQGLRRWEPGRGAAPGCRLGLHAALALVAEVGASPWLIVSPSFDEAEWAGLIEYLAGPADSPYGARRAAAGRLPPWTDAFSRIRIEFGNETWNALFEPWRFANGTQYGRYAEYFFTAARSSPHFPAVAGRIDFVLGGWLLSAGPRGFGTRARQASASAAIVGLQCYLEAWRHFEPRDRTSDDRFRHILRYAPTIAHYLTDQHAASHRLLGKMGTPAALATAEGGPDYDLPTPGMAYDGEQDRFGKSLASAVGTLDSFLYNAARGFGPQAYHAFGVGARWTSHSGWDDGFRPHPAWLALQLRNIHAAGDMVEATVTGGPRIDLPPIDSVLTSGFSSKHYHVPARAGVPLVAAYAFRAPGRLSLFVLSRRLARPTTVHLHLPTAPGAAMLYTLAGDPRANNIDTLQIPVRRRILRGFFQDHSFELPPGAIYLFVIDTA